ncbi:MAG: hypothetical protein ACXW15_01520, partial [Acidimicrobiia bacterium]
TSRTAATSSIESGPPSITIRYVIRPLSILSGYLSAGSPSVRDVYHLVRLRPSYQQMSNV